MIWFINWQSLMIKHDKICGYLYQEKYYIINNITLNRNGMRRCITNLIFYCMNRIQTKLKPFYKEAIFSFLVFFIIRTITKSKHSNAKT